MPFYSVDGLREIVGNNFSIVFTFHYDC